MDRALIHQHQLQEVHAKSIKTAGFLAFKSSSTKNKHQLLGAADGVANVKVAVRLRPLLHEEEQQGFSHLGSKIEVDHNRVQIAVDRPANSLNQMSEEMRRSQMNMATYKTFRFDHVFTEDQSQEEFFNEANISYYVDRVVMVSYTSRSCL